LKQGEEMIIDCRLRPPTEQFKAVHKYVEQVTAGLCPSSPIWYEQSVDECVKEMEDSDIVGAVTGRLLPNSFTSHGGGGSGANTEGTSTTNEHIYELVQKYPGRFIPIAGIDYTDRKKAMEEIEKIAKWGFKGINLELILTNEPYLPGDRRLYPIYAQCEDLGLVCSLFTSPISAGYSIENNWPFAIDQVAGDFPNLKIYLVHGCYPLVEQLINLVWRRPNIWFSNDCYIFAPGSQLYIDACNYSAGDPENPIYPLEWTRIQDRYCYASAYPFSSPPTQRVAEFKKLGWKEEILPKLMYENAAELYGL
jgi:uncharacterized protein